MSCKHPRLGINLTPNDQASAGTKVAKDQVDGTTRNGFVHQWFPYNPYPDEWAQYPLPATTTITYTGEQTMEFGLLEEVEILFPNGETDLGYFIKEDNGNIVVAADLESNSPYWIVKKSAVSRISQFANQENSSDEELNEHKEKKIDVVKPDYAKSIYDYEGHCESKRKFDIYATEDTGSWISNK